MIQGDTPTAACYHSPEETDYRTPAHRWRTIDRMEAWWVCAANGSGYQCCDECGALRVIDKEHKQ